LGGEVNVLDPEAGTLQQAQAGTVEQDCHETRDAAHPLKDGSGLFAGQHDGQPGGALRSDDVVEPGRILFEEVAIQKQNGAQGLVLSGRGDVPFDDESAQELRHLGASHLGRMTFAMEEDEPADPRDVGLLGPPAIVASTNGRADVVEQATRSGRQHRLAR
jgi:hypothetical protein